MTEVAEAFIAQARSLLSRDYLPKIERCLEKLSDEDVWWRANPESNSIGNLLLHLAGNARQWITSGLGALGADQRVRQVEFDERSVIPGGVLLARLDATLKEVDGVLARLDPSSILERHLIQGHDVTALEAILHVVEHFSMHTGQIILITKMLKTEDLKFYDFSGGTPTPNWQNKSEV
jgi:uncharacterized damage-inducible protein DinB